MLTKNRLLLLLGELILLFNPVPANAQAPVASPTTNQQARAERQQEPGDILRINTHVVFTDVLIKDKKTGQAVKGLTRENFQVLDDGHPRTLTYFSREGDARARPLALVIVLDIWGGESISLLKKTEVAEQIINAINKLSPDDEVGIMLTWAEGNRADLTVGKCEMVSDLTRDRDKTAVVLRTVPARVAQLLAYYNSLPAGPRQYPGTVAVPAGVAQGGLGCASDEISKLATGSKANSQVVTIVLTDDLVPFESTVRKESRSDLLMSGVTVSGVIMRKWSLADKVFFGVAKPFTSVWGLFSVEYFSKETGGETIKVNRPEQFSSAIMQLVDNLAARYSLGFTLSENEAGVDRLHRLEVKVEARDERNRRRKIVISARRGYYLPKRK